MWPKYGHSQRFSSSSSKSGPVSLRVHISTDGDELFEYRKILPMSHPSYEKTGITPSDPIIDCITSVRFLSINIRHGKVSGPYFVLLRILSVILSFIGIALQTHRPRGLKKSRVHCIHTQTSLIPVEKKVVWRFPLIHILKTNTYVMFSLLKF